jgi:hypothetical protein
VNFLVFLGVGLFFHGLFKRVYGLPQTLPQIREGLGPKDQKSNHQNNYEFLGTDTKHGFHLLLSRQGKKKVSDVLTEKRRILLLERRGVKK